MNIDHIPHQPGIYIFRDRHNQTLYIGKAKNLYKRVSQYYTPNTLRKRDMTAKADNIDFIITESDEEAILLETNLILKHKPPYNRLIKWDNSYIYIKIENWSYPNIYITRYRANDGAIYIWPKQFRNELKALLWRFRQLWGYRSCKKTQFETWKLCSDFMFGICKWWCIYNKLKAEKAKVTEWNIFASEAKQSIDMVDINNKYLFEAKKLGFKIDKSEYSPDIYINKYRQIIKYMTDFFGGNDDTVKWYIKTEIEDCVKNQNFEWASKLRDIYINLDKRTTKQNIYLESGINWQFWQIRQVSDRYIYIIVNYQWGKIVDILKFDEKADDIDSDSIIAKIELEYGTMTKKSTKLVKSENSTNIYGRNKELKPSKEDIKSIYDQIENVAQSHILSSVYKTENIMSDLLGDLQKRYGLTYYPYDIDCLDISHLGGDRASGAISNMQWWLPNPKWYRQYKISVDKWWDDFASIEEVLIKRFDSRKGDKYIHIPNLFVIDGWVGQLNVAKKLLQTEKYIYIWNNVQFVALGKWSARKSSSKALGEKETIYRLDRNWEIIPKDMIYDDVDRLLTKIRDEAHRFSNRYRKKQMEKEIR